MRVYPVPGRGVSMVAPRCHKEDDPPQRWRSHRRIRLHSILRRRNYCRRRCGRRSSRPSVRREALLNRLSSIEADVITLTSPAGYGKSTLLAQWADAEAGSRRFVWVNGSVGADPSLTLAYFAAALHEVSGLADVTVGISRHHLPGHRIH